MQVVFADRPPEKTETARKTLNPQWNQDFRFEARQSWAYCAPSSPSRPACFRPQVQDDCMVQDNPVQLRVWDYDIMKNDIIGSVYVPT
jgi:hypothetical protein